MRSWRRLAGFPQQTLASPSRNMIRRSILTRSKTNGSGCARRMDGKAIVAITNWQSILPVFASAYQLPLVGAHAGCVGAESLHIGPVFGSRIVLPGKLPIET